MVRVMERAKRDSTRLESRFASVRGLVRSKAVKLAKYILPA